MYVGRDSRWLIEGAAANEPHLRTAVLAEDRHLAGRTSEDPLVAAVVARHVYWLRDAREQLHTVGLDQQVDDESASGLSLAVQAVTAMREERIGHKPVANRSAGAATLTWGAHVLLPKDKCDAVWTVSLRDGLRDFRARGDPRVPLVPSPDFDRERGSIARPASNASSAIRQAAWSLSANE
jgi:hypothetical protein